MTWIFLLHSSCHVYIYILFSLSLLLQFKFLCKLIPRQIKAEEAVSIIRKTVEDLIERCREIVESEGERIDGEEYVNDTDPSILRFLLASREEVCCIPVFYCHVYCFFIGVCCCIFEMCIILVTL